MREDWAELRSRWRESTPAHGPKEIAMEQVLAKLSRFDSGIRARNWVRMFALLVTGGMSVALLWKASAPSQTTGAALLGISVIAQLALLRRRGNVAPDPPPEANVREFRGAVAEKLNRQIRYLRSSRAAGAVMAVGVTLYAGAGLWRHDPTGGLTSGRVLFVAGLAALFVFVGVVQHRWQVRRLEEDRDELLEAVREDRSNGS